MRYLIYALILCCTFLRCENALSQGRQFYSLEELSDLSEHELSEVRALDILIDSAKIEQLYLLENITELELLYITYGYGNNSAEVESLITRSLKKISQVNSLTISFDSLTYVPKIYKSCNGLKGIGIMGNALANFPDDLYKVKSLEEVHISIERLPEIHKDLGKICGLISLEINSDSLTYIPKEIDQLVNLKHLRISSKKLDILPDIWRDLQELEELEIICQQLRQIEGDLGTLQSLKTLQIKDAFHLEHAPSGLSFLPNLWQFKLLDAWKINSLQSIGNSISITDLYLTGFDLAPVLKTINSLNNLEYLVLDYHYFTLLSNSNISSLSMVAEIKLERQHKVENGTDYYSIEFYEIDQEQLQRIKNLLPSVKI